MRPVARIDRICEKLRELWHIYPDQRLGQLIENDIIPPGKMRGPATCWIFYCEDNVAERNLNKSLKRARKEDA